MSAVSTLYLPDEDATVAAGEHLGRCFSRGVVFMEGVLGAGKTTFCRGVLRALGHSGAVKSPTYTLVEPYELPRGKVYHFDLYRLGDPEELEFLGIRDYFRADSLCIVEWPSRGEGLLPAADLLVTLQPQATGRRLTVHALTTEGKAGLEAVRQGADTDGGRARPDGDNGVDA